MLKWLAKKFEQMCSVCVIVNFIIGGIAGVIIGSHNASITLLCLIGGLLIAFFINVMSFGFLAQIIEIRKKLDSLEHFSCFIENKEEEE